jgi:hypothetical protein
MAVIKGGDGLRLNWSVMGGVIVGDHGTHEITIRTRLDRAETISATLNIDDDGGPPFCETSKRFDIEVVSVKAILFERLENPSCEYHMAIMDGYFIELNNNPTAAGYILIYASPQKTATSDRQIRSYVNGRRFPTERLVIIHGGGTSRRATIEYWVTPIGAEPPKPTLPPANGEPISEETIVEESIDPKKPYIYSSEYYDGVQCYFESSEIDLDGYARMLKEHPKSRGNIVIMLTSKAEFRKKEREILKYLIAKGINGKRLRTFHQKAYGGVELWILP